MTSEQTEIQEVEEGKGWSSQVATPRLDSRPPWGRASDLDGGRLLSNSLIGRRGPRVGGEMRQVPSNGNQPPAGPREAACSLS